MSDIVAHVCGGAQAEKCVDGKEHKMTKIVNFYSGTPGTCFDIDGEWWHEPGSCPHCRIAGASVACEVCGITAMDIDMLRLP